MGNAPIVNLIMFQWFDKVINLFAQPNDVQDMKNFKRAALGVAPTKRKMQFAFFLLNFFKKIKNK